MFQRGVDVERHHQARCEPQWVIRLACWLYDCSCSAVDLLHTCGKVCVYIRSVLQAASSSRDSLTGFYGTCSGSLSCRRPLCRRVVWRIFTSSAGLQDKSRGISSKSLCTKLSWRCGSSVRNILRKQRDVQQPIYLSSP